MWKELFIQALGLALGGFSVAQACEKSAIPEVFPIQVAISLTNEQAARLLKHFPQIEILHNSPATGLEISTQKLSVEERETLQNDLDFLSKNTEIPLENIFSTLANYQPANASQEAALQWARRLLMAQPMQGAGLFLEGSVGLGKTHLSVALAKEFFRRGLRVLYINSHQKDIYSLRPNVDLYDVFILDDFNNGFHCLKDVFTAAVYKVHTKGGKLFVTTNSTYDKIVSDAVGREDLARYQDRTKSMFKVLRLQGESFRQDTGWFNE